MQVRQSVVKTIAKYLLQQFYKKHAIQESKTIKIKINTRTDNKKRRQATHNMAKNIETQNNENKSKHLARKRNKKISNTKARAQTKMQRKTTSRAIIPKCKHRAHKRKNKKQRNKQGKAKGRIQNKSKQINER